MTFNGYTSDNVAIQPGDSGGPWYKTTGAAVGLTSYGYFSGGTWVLSAFVRVDQNAAQADTFVRESGDGTNFDEVHAYFPINPIRLLNSTAVGGGTALTVTVSGVPGGTPSIGGAVVSVAVVSPSAPGYLALYASGEALPASSALNYSAGDVRSASVQVRTSDLGQFRIYSSANTNVIVDLVGWTMDGRAQGALAGGTRFVSANQTRIADVTIPSGGTALITAPTAAVAAQWNLTTVAPGAAGFLSVYPSGIGWPGTSSLNYGAGDYRAQMAITRLTSNQARIYNGGPGPVRVLVDNMGRYIDAGTTFAGRQFPTLHQRRYDTRFGGLTAMGAGESRLIAVTDDGNLRGYLGDGGAPGYTSAALIVNIASLNSSGPGYLTAWGSGAQPGTSMLNFLPGQVVSNTIIVPVVPSGGYFTLFSSAATDVIVDVQGWVVT